MFLLANSLLNLINSALIQETSKQANIRKMANTEYEISKELDLDALVHLENMYIPFSLASNSLDTRSFL